MTINRRLLSIIGRRQPAIFDVFPGGPLSRLSAVSLNPQPLPPHELGATIAAEFLKMAWLVERFDLDRNIAFQDLEDWCPIGLKYPKLPPWLWPIPPDPEPDPHPDWFLDFHLGFAARLAASAGEFEGSQLGEALDRAIARSEESMDAIVGST